MGNFISAEWGGGSSGYSLTGKWMSRNLVSKLKDQDPLLLWGTLMLTATCAAYLPAISASVWVLAKKLTHSHLFGMKILNVFCLINTTQESNLDEANFLSMSSNTVGKYCQSMWSIILKGERKSCHGRKIRHRISACGNWRTVSGVVVAANLLVLLARHSQQLVQWGRQNRK